MVRQHVDHGSDGFCPVTSPLVDDPETLRRILSQAEVLLLDFDGPVCDLFAGLPASIVVDQLCVVLADGGYGEPPLDIEKSSDPFDVLKYAAGLGAAEANYVNAAFIAHEVEAASSAQATAGADRVINTWSNTGRPIAVVSNNSVVAINSYLDRRGLMNRIAYISGRLDPSPERLKPDPYLIYRALSELGVHAKDSAFIGDSISDIEAARAAGVISIAYANGPTKEQLFLVENPGVIVKSMIHVAESMGGTAR